MNGLTQSEITRIVNRYIGVNEGYLGDFTYRSHREFYSEYCSLEINPEEIPGTTRERFLQILSTVSPGDQARIIRGILERFPVGGVGAPTTRTDELRKDLSHIAQRLEGTAVDSPSPINTSEVVRRAINDAETLLKTTEATSGVDRIHTAVHGHLIAICKSAELSYPDNASLTTLYKILRERHPRLTSLGVRGAEIDKVLKGLSTILDALQPVRNTASIAHPNEFLLDPAEALLVINCARTILFYLDAKTLGAENSS